MKTLTYICMAIMAFALASCSGTNPTPAEVAAKIDSHQVLSEADYATMIEYCGAYAKDAQQYFDLIDETPNDSTAVYNHSAQKLADLKASSPYVDMFREAIYAATDEQIGKANVAKVNEYEKYEAFPLPEGSGPALEQPGVVGDIEEMPASDTSQVISTGAGVAVEAPLRTRR